jgi:hypothetical protein
MERFQATLMRDNKVVLDHLTGTFFDPSRAAGFLAAPAGTSLAARSSYQLTLVDGQTLSIMLTKVISNAHRLAIIEFTVSQ